MRSSRGRVITGFSLATLVALSCNLAGSAPIQASSRSQQSQAASRSAFPTGSIEIGTLSTKGTSAYNWERNLADQVQKDYPGTNITLTFDNGTAIPAIQQRWRAGHAPDSDYGMFNGTDPATWSWVDNGYLLDMTKYMNQTLPGTTTKWINTFTPTVRKFMTDPRSGKIYAVPTEVTSEVLFYNQKMFTNYGIKPPHTWAEFLAAGEALEAKSVDPVAVTGLFAPYMGMWSDYLFERLVGAQKTYDVIHGKGSVKDDPGFLKALEMIQDMRDRHFFLKGFQGTNFTTAQLEFFQGKTGMILMGSWLVAEMKDSIPAGFQLGIVPFPTIPGGKGDQTALLGTANEISVNAKTKYPDLVTAYLRQFTSKSMQANRTQALGLVSPVLGVPSPASLPGISKILSGARSGLVPSYFGTINNATLSNAYYNQIGKLIFGQQNAQQTLANLDQALKQANAK